MQFGGGFVLFFSIQSPSCESRIPSNPSTPQHIIYSQLMIYICQAGQILLLVPDLCGLAHAAEWELYDLCDLEHVSWLGYLY